MQSENIVCVIAILLNFFQVCFMIQNIFYVGDYAMRAYEEFVFCFSA